MSTYKTQDGKTHASKEMAITYCLEQIEFSLSQLWNYNSPAHKYLHDHSVFCRYGNTISNIKASDAEIWLTSIEAWKAQIFVLERMK